MYTYIHDKHTQELRLANLWALFILITMMIIFATLFSRTARGAHTHTHTHMHVCRLRLGI